VADAVGRAPNSPVVAGEMQRLMETLPRLWQETKWENNHKEAYWRLTVSGIPLLAHAAGGGGAVWVRGEARPRRIAGAARQHHFWACPVARLETAIARANLWLTQAPGRCGGPLRERTP
jgi:hypothetical protein